MTASPYTTEVFLRIRETRGSRALSSWRIGNHDDAFDSEEEAAVRRSSREGASRLVEASRRVEARALDPDGATSAHGD